jgi:hypothetical protein
MKPIRQRVGEREITMIVEHVHAVFFFAALVILEVVLFVIMKQSDPDKELPPDAHGTDAHEGAQSQAAQTQPAQTVSGFEAFLTEKWSPLLCSVGYGLIEMIVVSPLGGDGPWRGWTSLADWSLCASSAIVLAYALWLNRRRVRGVRLPSKVAKSSVSGVQTAGLSASKTPATESTEEKEEN